ncbi:MAG: hypothetical protein AABX35_02625 [Nanoarchaeota archaeon]
METYANEVIATHKWHLSRWAGRDVGTPKTVDDILRIRDRAVVHGPGTFADHLREFIPSPKREELIRDYLTKDIDTLSGELRRYQQQQDGKGNISPATVENYTRDNNLSGKFKTDVIRWLGF